MATNTNNNNTTANNSAPLGQVISSIKGIGNKPTDNFFYNFNWPQIPQVAVLTGINGSGKTRLLSAISGQFEDTSNAKFYFNGNEDTYLLNNTYAYVEVKGELFSSNTNSNANRFLENIITDLAQRLSRAENSDVNKIRLNFYDINSRSNYNTIETIESFLQVTIPENTKYLYFDGLRADNTNNHDSLASSSNLSDFTILQSYIKFISQLPENQNKSLVELLKLPLNKPALLKAQLGTVGTLSITALEQLFIQHKQKAIESIITQYNKQVTYNNKSETVALNSNLLDNTNAPWTIINEFFKTHCKLSNSTQKAFKYTVTQPSDNPAEVSGYKLQFKNTTKQDIIEYSQLSTGEQVIVQLVCMFFALNNLGNNNSASLLLLDEFDANLNPQLSKMYINLVTDLAKEFNVQVILTTHSPITVCHAPKDSVFLLKDGTIDTKKNQQQILEQLTPGMLIANDVEEKALLKAIKTIKSNENICFVEGESDVIYLNAIKQELQKEDSFTDLQKIEFIAMGGASKSEKFFNFTEIWLTLYKDTQPNFIFLLDNDTAGRGVDKDLKSKKQEIANRIVFIKIPEKDEQYTNNFKPEKLDFEIEHLVQDEFYDDKKDDFTKNNLFLPISNFMKISDMLNPERNLDQDAHNTEVEKIQKTIFGYKKNKDTNTNANKLEIAKTITSQANFYTNYKERFEPTIKEVILKIKPQKNTP